MNVFIKITSRFFIISKIFLFKLIINILFVITFIILYFLQLNFFSWFRIAGVMPNIFIIIMLYIGLYMGRSMGIVYGIILRIQVSVHFLGKSVKMEAYGRFCDVWITVGQVFQLVCIIFILLILCFHRNNLTSLS